MKKNKDVLETKSRETILIILYDGKKRSAYSLAKSMNLATATIILHLRILENHGYIKSWDDAQGKLRRGACIITKKGKEALIKHMKDYYKDIQKQLNEYDFLNILFFDVFHIPEMAEKVNNVNP